MGRTIASLLALAAVCMCFTSCNAEPAESSAETGTSSESSTQQQETAAETEEFSEPAGAVLSAAERAKELAAKKGVHVSDETGTLTNEELNTLNQTAEAFSGTVYAAAVITDQLGDVSPDAFAAEYYDTLYGEDSTGFLILVNNDTGEDRVYTSGACSLYMTQDAIDLAITQVTPQIVTGEYAPALEQLFLLVEMMPDTIYDRSGILSREQYDNFLSIAEAAMEGSKKQYSVLLVDTQTWQTENSLQIYTDTQCGVLEADGLLVIDVQEMICAVSGEFSDAAAMTAELNAILQDTASLPITAAVTEYYDQVKALD